MFNKLFSQPKRKTLFIIGVVIFLAGVWYFLRWMNERSKAAPGVPTLSYGISTSALQSGQNFDLVLKVNPNGASFNAFELYTSYDPSKTGFQNSNLSQNIVSTHTLVNSSIDTSGNIVTVIGAKLGSPFSGNSEIEIARVKMKVLPGANGDVNFDWGSATKLGSNINKELMNGVFTIGGGSTVSTTPAPGGPDLHLDSVDHGTGVPTLNQGQGIDIQVFLKTNGEQVKSVDFVLPYDDSQVTFQNEADLPSNIEISPDSGFNTQFVIKNIDTNARKIVFALASSTPVSSTADILLATLKFKVKDTATDGEVRLLPDASSTIYNMQTQNILSCTGGYRFNVGQGEVPTDTPTPGDPTNTPDPGQPTDTPVTEDPTPTVPFPTTPPTVTQVPGGVAMVLDLKLRFQGVTARPNRLNTIPVQVTVSQGSFAQAGPQSVSANFTADENGIWSGQAYFPSLLEAANYKIFIKGPMHLRKRICDAGPGEDEPGRYTCISGNIQLNAGTNQLDFSGINLISGDLPQQDGVANAYDIALTRNNLGTTDPALLTQADVNFDGIVDTQDYSLVIEALAIRTDDEI